MSVKFTLPIRTENEQNRTMGRHWGVKSRSRNKVRLLAAHATNAHFKPVPRIVVKMTRVSAGEMDDDGLRSALKSTRDGVASALRIDDGSKLIKFEYDQRRCARGEFAVEIEIT